MALIDSSAAVASASPLNRSSAQSPSSITWETITPVCTRRNTIWQIWGGTGSGRTSLAATAPGPIASLSSVENQDWILQPAVAASDKLIRRINFNSNVVGMDPQQASDAMGSMWQYIIAATLDSFKWAKTIIIDTESTAWEVLQLSEMGSLDYEHKTPQAQKKGQLMYPWLYAQWKGLWLSYYDPSINTLDTNLIFISKESGEWRNKQPTGNIIPKCCKETPFMAQVVVNTKREPLGTGITATIQKSTINGMVTGAQLADSNQASMDERSITFPYIMSMITGTDPTEWS